MVVGKRVQSARQLQYQRNGGVLNARLSGQMLDAVVDLPEALLHFVEHAVERLRLSTRAYFRILKVARTIADLAGCPEITREHLAEAIAYRYLDRSTA